MVFNPTPREPNFKAMLNFGWEYLSAAKVLHANKSGISPQGPFNYIISHAFELFLKSYLMSRGLKYKDLKSFKHDIKSLFNKCLSLGMDAHENDSILVEVIDNLNVYQMQRYPMLGLFKIGPIPYANPENLIAHVESYGKRVQVIIEKEAA